MNYRHAYHAGNHADVLKHVVLTRVLAYLRQKPVAFAVLDAHAGIGRYDLKGAEAYKTGEWKDGIGRLLAKPLPDAARNLMALYLNMIHDLNPDGTLRHYPGSPEIIARLLRAGDRMVFNELHPADADTLQTRFAGDRRAKLTRLDAAIAVKVELPFYERRGLVLLDPAYERTDEMQNLPRLLRHIFQRMKNAVVLAWYPLKEKDATVSMKQELAACVPGECFCAELQVRENIAEGGLAGSGLAICNPTFTLRGELEVLLPILADRLGEGKWGRGGIVDITPPR